LKSATENVHIFEKKVMRLERIVEQEKESYEAIQLDLIVANREFRDFKHNQYEVMKGKYE